MKSIALVFSLAGCSWLGVSGPSSTQPDCTTSTTLPVIDTVVVAGFIATLVGTAIAAVQCNNGPDPELCPVPLMVLGIPAGLASIPYAFSARHGYRTVSKCRRVKAGAQTSASMVK